MTTVCLLWEFMSASCVQKTADGCPQLVVCVHAEEGQGGNETFLCQAAQGSCLKSSQYCQSDSPTGLSTTYAQYKQVCNKQILRSVTTHCVLLRMCHSVGGCAELQRIKSV